MDEDNLYRLQGTSEQEQKGGLIIIKKSTTFKVPKPSLLGLDKLALAKRREKEDAARKISFTVDEEEDKEKCDEMSIKSKHSKSHRKIRSPYIETPTHTGGITDLALKRRTEKLNFNRNKEKGVFASTKTLKSYNADRKHNDDYKSYKQEFDGKYNRDRKRTRGGDSSNRNDKTPRFRDEPRTPNLKIKDEVSKSSWDEDDPAPMRTSSWDFPTPSSYKSNLEWSERSMKSRRYGDSERSNKRGEYGKYNSDTPRFTPVHKYNVWMKDSKRTDAPSGLENEEEFKWQDDQDRELWEDEQKRIDREWYNLDEGMLKLVSVVTIQKKYIFFL